MKRFWFVIIAAGIAVMAMSALQYLTRPRAGDQALPFELISIDSKPVSLEGFKGRPVIVHFWASWCGACRAEFPSLAQLQPEFAKEGLVVLAISEDEQPRDAAGFAAPFKSGLTVLFDPEGEVADSYQSFAVPETFFIDKDGKIAWRRAGPIDWGSPDVSARVKGLIGG